MIYCVEDDNNIRELVLYALKTGGFEPVGFSDGVSFWEGMGREIPELVLLDIMLPDEDGVGILKKLKQRSEYRDIPVIMLTAKGAEYDKVQSLELGADDYVTKPFGVMELIARVKAVRRRAGPKREAEERLTYRSLSLDRKRRSVTVGEEDVALTFKEFELLEYLMENEGIVLSREKLLDVIWGYQYEGETRTVDVHIGSLRQKLNECGEAIRTVRGVGYRLGGKG